jgi:hypothetical protein
MASSCFIQTPKIRTRELTVRPAVYVRFGSKADICNAKWHVRFTPKSGPLPAWPLELKATSGTVTVRIAENGFATSRS